MREPDIVRLSAFMASTQSSRAFNSLEKELLGWFASHASAPELAEQLQRAGLLRREYTVVGFRIWLRVFGDVPFIPGASLQSPVAGPGILSSEIDQGGKTRLWLTDDGFIDCLEMWSVGGHFAETLSNFELADKVAVV